MSIRTAICTSATKLAAILVGLLGLALVAKLTRFRFFAYSIRSLLWASGNTAGRKCHTLRLCLRRYVGVIVFIASNLCCSSDTYDYFRETISNKFFACCELQDFRQACEADERRLRTTEQERPLRRQRGRLKRRSRKLKRSLYERLCGSRVLRALLNETA